MESTMHLFVVIILCAALLNPSVLGIYLRNFRGENKHFDFDYSSENDTLNILSDSSENSSNVSEYPADEQRRESTSDILSTETIRTEKPNSTLASSSPVALTKNAPDTLSTGVEILQTEVSSNGTNSTSLVPNLPSSPSSSTGQTQSSTKSTSLGTTTSKGIIVSSTEDEEQEGVVRGKPFSTESSNTTTSKTETIYQKALALISDTYTLSILIPVAAGIIFASTIIITIAICKCFRRQCRRRRLRKKTLPDSVKHLRPSDRARLLAESSDEEF